MASKKYSGGVFVPTYDYDLSGQINFERVPTYGAWTPAAPSGTGSFLTDGTAQTVTGVKTFTTPVLTNGGTGYTSTAWGLFTEDATSLTHTMTFTIPAGAVLLDIYVVANVLWGAGTSATFTCGDANAATGWFTATNLKATDLLVGERLQASNANNWGGVQGAYLTTAGRFGRQSTTMIGGYCATATSVIGVVTVVGPSATTGRTYMGVNYSIGQAVVPVLA